MGTTDDLEIEEEHRVPGDGEILGPNSPIYSAMARSWRSSAGWQAVVATDGVGDG